jgi:hypothetical protein
MTHAIFLLGHRRQHGKNFCGDVLEALLREKNISYITTSFAKKLKQHCAERYDLDFKQMEYDDYKKSKPKHLNGLSVRDVLIKEGNFARSIWENVWTYPAYQEIFNAKKDFGLITDFRYNNEYFSFYKIYSEWAKKNPPITKETVIIPVLVHREKGVFNDDGADNNLPDLEGVHTIWKEVIYNNVEGNGWKEHIKTQVEEMLERNLIKLGIS